jgi:hypothetical protein
MHKRVHSLTPVFHYITTALFTLSHHSLILTHILSISGREISNQYQYCIKSFVSFGQKSAPEEATV